MAASIAAIAMPKTKAKGISISMQASLIATFPQQPVLYQTELYLGITKIVNHKMAISGTISKTAGRKIMKSSVMIRLAQ